MLLHGVIPLRISQSLFLGEGPIRYLFTLIELIKALEVAWLLGYLGLDNLLLPLGIERHLIMVDHVPEVTRMERLLNHWDHFLPARFDTGSVVNPLLNTLAEIMAPFFLLEHLPILSTERIAHDVHLPIGDLCRLLQVHLLLLIVVLPMDIDRLVLKPCRYLLLVLTIRVMLQRVAAVVVRHDKVLVLPLVLEVLVLRLAQ